MLKAEQMTTLEKKIGSFSRILETRPGDELTMLALAEASFRRGFKLEALTAYQDVVSSKPVPEALLAVAEIYSAQGMTQEAYGELRHLFAIDPENVEARLLVNTLQEDALPPEDLRSFMERPTTQQALEEARLRLKIQRMIYNRELQERTRNVTLEPGTVIHEYHMEEAKKKLIRVDELLRELERFWEYNETLQMLPTADPVSSESHPDSPVEEAESFPPVDPNFADDTLQFHSSAPEESLSPADLGPSFDSEPQFDPGEDEPVSYGEGPIDHGVGQLDNDSELPTEAIFSESSDLASGTLEPSSDTVVPSDPEADMTFDSLELEQHSAGISESLPPSENAEESDEREPSEDRGFENDLGLTPALDLEVSPRPIEDPQPKRPPDFTPDFDLSVESPLAPDLPDLGVEEASSLVGAEEVSVMIDLAPIVMGEEISDSMALGADRPELYESRPQPTISDAPEIPHRHEPMAVVMPSVEDDSTMILGGLETPPMAASFVEERFTAPGATEETSSLEPSIEVSAVSSGEIDALVEVSPARRAFYQTHAESLSALTSTLARTRGVTSIYLVAREGETIDSVAKDDISEERIGELVKDSFEFLEAFASDPAYWVLECAGGIFVMQKLDARHVLIAVGQAGANFGALRYTMDKTRAKFEQLLAQTPD